MGQRGGHSPEQVHPSMLSVLHPGLWGQVVTRVQMLVPAIRAKATGFFLLYREEEGERQSRSDCTGRLEWEESRVPSFAK